MGLLGSLPFSQGKHRGLSVIFFFACELLFTVKILKYRLQQIGFKSSVLGVGLPQGLWEKCSEVNSGEKRELPSIDTPDTGV